MAERTYGQDTGIYQEWTEHMSSEKADESSNTRGMMLFFKEWSDRHNHRLENLLHDVHEAAEQILDSDTPGEHVVDGPCRAAFIKDIQTALSSCRTIRSMLERGDYLYAVNEAIGLGVTIERANIRPYEPNARAGRGARGGGRTGASKVNLPGHEINARDAEICLVWGKLRRQYPTDKMAVTEARLVKSGVVADGKAYNLSVTMIQKARGKQTQ